MLTEYIRAAMERAHYKIIDDEEPYYANGFSVPVMR